MLARAQVGASAIAWALLLHKAVAADQGSILDFVDALIGTVRTCAPIREMAYPDHCDRPMAATSSQEQLYHSAWQRLVAMSTWRIKVASARETTLGISQASLICMIPEQEA